MSASQSRFARFLHRQSRSVAGTLAVASLGVGLIYAAPAAAHTRQSVAKPGYQLPTTVVNFCAFSPSLGNPTTGTAANGMGYAAWSLGTDAWPYVALDTTGDRHIDIVMYAPLVDGVPVIKDYGMCNGPSRDRWFARAAYQQQVNAGNQAWGEMEPGLLFSGEMQVIDDM